MQLTMVSIAPFDTGVSLGTPHDRAAAEFGWTEHAEPPWDLDLLPTGVRVWDTPAAALLIVQSGVGLALHRRTFDVDLGNPDDIAKILVERARLHGDLDDGSHDLCELVDLLRSKVARSSLLPFGRYHRRDIWGGIPYVFTFYEVESRLEQVLEDKAAMRGLSSLCEPSQVIGEDTVEHATGELTTEDVAARVRDIDHHVVTHDLENIDLRPDVDAFASWATVLIFHEGDDGHTRRFYETLELRLQFAWSKAHLVQEWGEQLLTTRQADAGEIEIFSLESVPMIRLANGAIDARASTRSQKVMQALVETSFLEHEVRKADDLVQGVLRQGDLLRARARRRYDLSIELLLLLLAASQVIPMITKVPVIVLPRPALAAIFAVLAVVGLLRRRG